MPRAGARRAHRDIVFIDQRGHGAIESPGLRSPMAIPRCAKSRQRDVSVEAFALAASAGEIADLRMYTTAPGRPMMTTVRRGWHYESRIWGGSYGHGR